MRAASISAFKTTLVTTLLLATQAALAGETPASAPNKPDASRGPVGTLEDGFRSPPMSARPRTWWHWLNGNISVDGIDKDLDWLASVGIGGIQNFDANLTTPQIVDKRLIYMQPDWKAAFRHAVERADEKGLEFAIASSPGWSETGGPWVAPQDGMKKLVWSETVLPGGKRFPGRIAAPPSATGPYQNVPAEEFFGAASEDKHPLPQASGGVAVLAMPISGAPLPQPSSAVRSDGSSVSLAALTDADEISAVEVPAGSAEKPALLMIGYARPVEASSARLLIKDALPPFSPPRYTARLQAEVDGIWHDVADIPLGNAATTVSFAPVRSARFRIAVSPGPTFSGGGLGSVPGAVVMNLFIAINHRPGRYAVL